MFEPGPDLNLWNPVKGPLAFSAAVLTGKPCLFGTPAALSESRKGSERAQGLREANPFSELPENNPAASRMPYTDRGCLPHETEQCPRRPRHPGRLATKTCRAQTGIQRHGSPRLERRAFLHLRHPPAQCFPKDPSLDQNNDQVPNQHLREGGDGSSSWPLRLAALAIPSHRPNLLNLNGESNYSQGCGIDYRTSKTALSHRMGEGESSAVL